MRSRYGNGKTLRLKQIKSRIRMAGITSRFSLKYLARDWRNVGYMFGLSRGAVENSLLSIGDKKAEWMEL
jgi:hypothetical protein